MWLMKICQFAIPRIKSSRRSLPLGGSVTVIRRAPFRIPFVSYDQKDRRPKPGRSPISSASACRAGQAAAPADVRTFASARGHKPIASIYSLVAVYHGLVVAAMTYLDRRQVLRAERATSFVWAGSVQ